jgi:hypothetical protein
VPSILERLVPDPRLRVRWHRWCISHALGGRSPACCSGGVIPIEVALGGRDGQTANEKVISAAPIVAFVVLAGVGVRVLAGQCGRAVRSRADEVAGAGIEIIISALGGFVIMLIGLFMLGVSANDLLPDARMPAPRARSPTGPEASA